MRPGARLAAMLAAGCVEPVVLLRDDAVVLCGEADVVLLCLRAVGAFELADKCELYRLSARAFVLSFDSTTSNVTVEGVPRGVSLSSPGGLA